MRTENDSLSKITSQQEHTKISSNLNLVSKSEKSDIVNQETFEQLYTEALSGEDISKPNKNLLKEYLFKNKGFNNEDWRNLMEIRLNLEIYIRYYDKQEENFMNRQYREGLLRN